jgi:hypothetical protein
MSHCQQYFKFLIKFIYLGLSMKADHLLPRIIYRKIGSSPPGCKPLATCFLKWPLREHNGQKQWRLYRVIYIARSQCCYSCEAAAARIRLLMVYVPSIHTIGKLLGLLTANFPVICCLCVLILLNVCSTAGMPRVAAPPARL